MILFLNSNLINDETMKLESPVIAFPGYRYQMSPSTGSHFFQINEGGVSPGGGRGGGGGGGKGGEEGRGRKEGGRRAEGRRRDSDWSFSF